MHFFSLVLSFVDNNDLVADWLVGGLKFDWHNILYSKFRWLFCVLTSKEKIMLPEQKWVRNKCSNFQKLSKILIVYWFYGV